MTRVVGSVGNSSKPPSEYCVEAGSTAPKNLAEIGPWPQARPTFRPTDHNKPEFKSLEINNKTFWLLKSVNPEF